MRRTSMSRSSAPVDVSGGRARQEAMASFANCTHTQPLAFFKAEPRTGDNQGRTLSLTYT